MTLTDLFRKQYTPLHPGQKILVSIIKDKAEELLMAFNGVPDLEKDSEQRRLHSRAVDALETAVMYAVKAATTSVS